MILTALNNYYARLRSDPEMSIPEPGYSSQKIHFCIVLGKDGSLKAVEDLRDHGGNRPQPRMLDVPEPEKRTVAVAPQYLWDNTTYVFGADGKENPDRAAQAHAAFKAQVSRAVQMTEDQGLKALDTFLALWNPEEASSLDFWEEMVAGNFVFRLDGERIFLHQRPKAKEAWQRFQEERSSEGMGICLATGLRGAISRLHPSIKGVMGAQSSGAALISFNLASFTSYGKNQNHNAPLSEDAAFAYTTALNHLLRPSSRQCVRLGDTTVVFWTERDSPAESLITLLFAPPKAPSVEPAEEALNGDAATHDGADAVRLRDFFEAVRKGHMPEGIDPKVRCFVLGLAPNASRLSVRFWTADTVGTLLTRMHRHFEDLRIVRQYHGDPEHPPLWSLLLETAAQRKGDNIPHILTGALARAMLTGSPYPTALLTAVLGRIRADKNVNYRRAALIKAYLVRQGKEVSVSLNTERTDAPYLLGRLFAVLEKAQSDAVPGANATIKDKYIASAAATPGRVMSVLLKNSGNHLAKLRKSGEKGGWGHHLDRLIQDIVAELEGFPATLAAPEQGEFMIGYYHQLKNLYTKKDTTPKED